VPPQTTRDYVYTVLIEYIVTQPDAAEAAFAALGADVAALAGPDFTDRISPSNEKRSDVMTPP